MRNGKKLKAVIPGGISTPILTPDKIDAKMDFDSLCDVGSMLGSGAVIVMDETTCMVKAARRMIEFFDHESCGKCTPCREGTYWLSAIMRRITQGKGEEEDLDLLEDICDNIREKTLCPLGDGAIVPILSTLKNFRDEYVQHIKTKRCPLER
jgi:NADH-quinone oxidoreductase subunit F